MDALFVTTTKRLQRLWNFTRESITKIPNQSHLYMFVFFVEIAEASERKCFQSSEAPPTPSLNENVLAKILQQFCFKGP